MDAQANQRVYWAPKGYAYISNRTITHLGKVIAVVLRKELSTGRLSFAYAVLDRNPPEAVPGVTAASDKSDNDRWPDNLNVLDLPAEVRFVGADIVPAFPMPIYDRSGNPLEKRSSPNVDPWRSSTHALTAPDVTHFEIASDGRFLYIFRQSRSGSDSMTPKISASEPSLPLINNNLLCDRFILAGTILRTPLEVRFSRSGHKGLPLNHLDTLGVRDMNGQQFLEPTLAITFVDNLFDGRFAVVRTPTMANGVFRWNIFAYSALTEQVHYFSVEISKDGLFDVHGRQFYTCTLAGVDGHEPVFARSPGACTATLSSGYVCGQQLVPLIDNTGMAARTAMGLHRQDGGVFLELDKSLDLSTSQFREGFTIEGWVGLQAFSPQKTSTKPNTGAPTTPAGPSPTVPSSSPSSGPSELPAQTSKEVADFLLQMAKVRSEIVLESSEDKESGSPETDATSVSGDLKTLADDGQGSESATAIGDTGAAEGPKFFYCLFASADGPSIFVDDQYHILIAEGEPSSPEFKVLGRSSTRMNVEGWTHVAFSFNPKSRAFNVYLNGELDPTAREVHLEGKSPGRLSRIGATLASPPGFILAANLDELRIWSFPLPEATIRSFMHSVAIGHEYGLVSNWRFEEGMGTIVHDATGRSPNLNLVSVKNISDLPIMDVWVVSDAPISQQTGLYRQTIRIRSDLHWASGLSATVYYIQLLNEGVKAQGPGESSQVKKPVEKPMKRNGRLLLSFAVDDGDHKGSLGLIDFGLSPVGVITYSGALIDLQPCSIPNHPLNASQEVTLPQLQVGRTFVPLYGGLLSIPIQSTDRVERISLGPNPPIAIESSVGDVLIYYRDQRGHLAGLTYSTLQRNKSGVVPSKNGPLNAVQLSVKEGVTSEVVVKGDRCEWIDSEVAFDLAIEGVHATQGKVIERWRGLPKHAASAANILRGGADGTLHSLGTLSKIISHTDDTKSAFSITLSDPFGRDLLVGYSIVLEHARFQVVKPAKKGQKDVWVSQPYMIADENIPQHGDPVYMVEYDYLLLANNQTHGSSLISFYHLLSGDANQILSPFTLSMSPDAPSSTLPRPSPVKALTMQSGQASNGQVRLKKDKISPAPTLAGSGLTFETWLRADNYHSVPLLTFTDEVLLSPDQSKTIPQTIMLLLTGTPDAGYGFYQIIGNVNGRYFEIGHDKTLAKGRWYHLAISFKQGYALSLFKGSYLDFGTSADLNVADFSVEFAVVLRNTGNDMTFLSKAENNSGHGPLELRFTSGNQRLVLRFTDVSGKLCEASVSFTFEKDTPYRIFVSREFNSKVDGIGSKQHHQVVFSILKDKDSKPFIYECQVEGGTVATSDAPLMFGNSRHSPSASFEGLIGSICLYGSAIPKTAAHQAYPRSNSLINYWKGDRPTGDVLLDRLGKSHGKLCGRPTWVYSPISSDSALTVMLNGRSTSVRNCDWEHYRNQVTPNFDTMARRQLTIGAITTVDNAPKRDYNIWEGSLVDIRLWRSTRTTEQICDHMFAHLGSLESDLIAYYPMVDMQDPNVILDESGSGWHLEGFSLESNEITGPVVKVSDLLMGTDPPLVTSAFHNPTSNKTLVDNVPGVTEYGDATFTEGLLSGAWKRLYCHTRNGSLFITSGFAVGKLATEWIAQVQTAPELRGYIEGGPPVPAEIFQREGPIFPISSVQFIHATNSTYTYSSFADSGEQIDQSEAVGGGGSWQVSAGIGMATTVSAGKVHLQAKTNLHISHGSVKNSFLIQQNNLVSEAKMNLTGSWQTPTEEWPAEYKPQSVGLALVRSDTADIFALRLVRHNRPSTLVAYTMQPNLDIPTDTNLLTFKINPFYTKQGTLDGKVLGKPDPDYPNAGSAAPSNASYFKPKEAYALRSQIRRAEQQLEGEYERFKTEYSASSMSQVTTAYEAQLKAAVLGRSKRSICNTYLWNANGGTYIESNSTIDSLRTEIGGNLNAQSMKGVNFSSEVDVMSLASLYSYDSLSGVHCTMTKSKAVESQTSFHVEQILPATGVVPKIGAVNAYRYMSFWLEPSADNTETFFNQVVDEKWLAESNEPSAAALRELQNRLATQSRDAKDKSWRLFHRVTYVSRNLEDVPGGTPDSGTEKDSAEHALPFDPLANWELIRAIDRHVSGSISTSQFSDRLREAVRTTYPTLSQSPMFSQILKGFSSFYGVA